MKTLLVFLIRLIVAAIFIPIGLLMIWMAYLVVVS